MSYKTGFYKGRLGIGLSNTMGMGDGNPRFPLDINGDIRITGSIVNEQGKAIISGGVGGSAMAVRQQNTTEEPSWTDNAITVENIDGNLQITGQLLTDGNVGIGTTSPISDLQIGNTLDKTSHTIITLASDGGSLYKQGIRMLHHGGAGGTEPQHGWYMFSDDLLSHEKLRIGKYDGNSTENDVLVIKKSNGNVGIGDTSPSCKLDVNGQIRGGYNSDTLSYFGRTWVGVVGGLTDHAGIGHIDHIGSGEYALMQANNGKTYLGSVSGQSIGFRIGNSDKMELTSGGILKIESYIEHYGDSSCKIGFPSNDNIYFYCSTTVQMRINNNGVGIHTDAPANSSHRLKVGGNVYVSGTITATSFSGNATTATTADKADKIKIQDSGDSTNTNYHITFGLNGYNDLYWDGNMYYNPYTNILTCPTFSGSLSGNANTASQVFVTHGPTTNSAHRINFTNSTGNGNAYIYGDSDFVFNPNTGYVGIGTNDPACGLELADEASLKSGIKFGRYMGAGYRESFPSSGTYAGFSTDNHGSFTIGNNCHMDINNCIKYNNTHSTMCGPAICMPGNAQAHQGSIIFYTEDPQSVTAGNTFRQIGNTPTLHLDHNGTVGIGEGAPAAKLHIYSSDNAAMKMVVPHAGKYFQTNFAWGGHHMDVYYHGSTKGFGSTGNGGSLHLNYYSSGNVTVSGGTNATSDDRIKHNEKIIINGLDIINQLEPKKYFKSLKRYDEDHNYDLDSSGNPITDDDYKIETGLIAQQVMIIDDLKYTVDEVEDKYKTVEKEKLDENGDVILDDDGKPVIEKKEEISLKGRYTVKYQDIFVYNIAATQELDKKVTVLEHNNNLQINNTENIIGNIPFVNGYTIVNDKKLYNNNISDKLYFNPATGKLNCPNIESTYYGDGSNLQGIATESQINDFIEENKKLKQDNENNKELINFWTQQAMNLNNKLTTMENELNLIKQNLGL